MKRILSILLVFSMAATTKASLVIVNGLSHEHIVQVGNRSQGSIVIKNTAETPKRAKIYKSDVEHNCDGQTQFNENTERDRCNSDWTLLSDNEIVISGGQSYTLTYEIEPKTDVEQNGSYWGVIMVEEIKDLDTLTPQRGVTVTSLIRYAIQIVTHFENENVKNLEIIGVDIDTTKEVNLLAVSINNTGNYMLKPIMILELYNESGEQVYRNEIPYQKVYPGFCKLFELPVEEVPKGTYNGILVADCGDENIYGLNLELEVPQPKTKP
ncbi:MAG: hypothetical protein JJ975_15065 [Bacteroidia bacterium]|nr:hypothetical protein [Bacteroidia bacterium]